MGQRRVGTAHVRLDLVNGTTDVLRVAAVEVRTWVDRLTGLRIDPDPAKTVNVVEQILSPSLPPTLQVLGGSVQMPTEGLTALTTLQTDCRPFRFLLDTKQRIHKGQHLNPLYSAGNRGDIRHPAWLTTWHMPELGTASRIAANRDGSLGGDAKNGRIALDGADAPHVRMTDDSSA